MRLFLRLWASGDFALYPEPKTPPADWVKMLSPMGLSHPINSHNPVNKDFPENLECSAKEEYSDFLIDNTSLEGLSPGRAGGDGAVEGGAADQGAAGGGRLRRGGKQGARGFNSEGKKKLRSACQIVEETAAGRAIGFLTLTLPSMSREMLDVATSKWSEIMRQYMQELSREMERVGLPSGWAFCTEWQEERRALHAHIAFIAHPTLTNPKGDEYPIKKEWYKSTWARILKNVLGEDFDCKAATRIEKVKTAVGAYMTEYISKGDKDVRKCKTDVRQLEDWELEELKESGRIKSDETIDTLSQSDILESKKLHPSAWWGSSKNLKTEVKKRIEVWEIKLKASDRARQSPVSEHWIEPAIKIVEKLDCYWAKIIESGEGIRRAIAGRLRVKKGWKQEASDVIFGKKFVVPPFNLNEPYWRWRMERDNCSLHQDKFAEIQWLRMQSVGEVAQKKTEVIGRDDFVDAIEFRVPVDKGFKLAASMNSARLGVIW